MSNSLGLLSYNFARRLGMALASGEDAVARSAEPEIVGNSPALRRAVDHARRFGALRVPVVLHGESGTGKELFARLVHAVSGRRGDFVPVNCAALPEALAESALFGHKRGAFTHATSDEAGLIASSSGGTLFLDEVGELSLSNQAKLLRVLQEGRVLRVGDSREHAVDLRIVCASHRDLRAQVAAGSFREDLYYRLATCVVEIPPLRERGRDVIALARASLASAAALGAPAKHLGRDAAPVLMAHRWPGNVRELQSVMLRVAVLGSGRSVTGDDLRAVLGVGDASGATHRARLAAEVGDAPRASSELASEAGVSLATAKRLLKQMIAAGEVTVVGTGRSTRYRRPAPEDGLDPKARVVLELVAARGEVTRMVVAQAAGVSLRTAGRLLAEMVAAGTLRPMGSGAAIRYRTG